jgi:hypothetical protein
MLPSDPPDFLLETIPNDLPALLRDRGGGKKSPLSERWAESRKKRIGGRLGGVLREPPLEAVVEGVGHGVGRLIDIRFNRGKGVPICSDVLGVPEGTGQSENDVVSVLLSPVFKRGLTGGHVNLGPELLKLIDEHLSAW